MHHHVALDEPIDFERLYRFINGTALGLVACGGGAYCAAHIGLYKALLESGLALDIVGGASGGGAMTHAELMECSYRWGLREMARLKAERHPVVAGVAVP